MSYTVEESKAKFGTPKYAGWNEPEASGDFLATGGNFNNTGSGQLSFNFDWEGEVSKAYDELGTYYNELLSYAEGDINKALVRLSEDYNTGKRFREQKFGLQLQALDLAQQNFATDAEKATKTLIANQIKRGISRQSVAGGGLGIADVERTNLNRNIALGQKSLDLRRTGLDTDLAQSEELALMQKQRMETDLPEELERTKKELEQNRRKEAGSLALSRQQRAYNRFEANLI